ncbi:MAG TPA: hypothetical protein VI979_03730 [archaeon]|nr:hypothetical protein [archaeon]
MNENLTPKFYAIATLYIAVLLFNVAYFILPTFDVIAAYAEFYVYLLLLLAPVAPLAMVLVGTEVAVHHSSTFAVIFTAMTVMSVFATIFFVLPVIF